MGLLINGLTECKLCNEKIDNQSEIFTFPAFILNENDPLVFFNDSSFHKECLKENPQYHNVMQRLNLYYERTGPGKRKCIVCKSEILDHSDHLMIDYLTPDKNNFLYKYNYSHVRKSHLNKWLDRDLVISHLFELHNSDKWGGNYLLNLIMDLKEEKREMEINTVYF